MYNILIDGGISYIMKDTNSFEFEPKNMLGFFINNKEIIDIINNLPIKNFYINSIDGYFEKITKEKAFLIYNKIIDSHNEELILKKSY